MVKYRPARKSLSSSVKEERVFSSRDEMILTVYTDFCNVMRFIGSSVKPKDFVVEKEGRINHQSGYADEHRILIRDKLVGFCDLQEVM